MSNVYIHSSITRARSLHARAHINGVEFTYTHYHAHRVAHDVAHRLALVVAHRLAHVIAHRLTHRVAHVVALR
jgi:hypothetical protein